MFDILDNGIVYFCGCAVFSFKNYIYNVINKF
jgi:hypothetical protein